ncbi:helix-turn-helix domain-containing protein [Paraburkholderia sp. DHOC27]|uniref:helix-turn-helix domain-containing protein n=1 Tax=Paraburkholderia sp. DHOC27 TaxID=2303330 RepID=UPI000E3CA653|nr:helix-turn-helix domain-containing protein [Paraburkholderia sp. DHOC27]RFU45016.1 helix-turn-helix domain-containing protein [Paraburkholderia sp. DHOC27]
MDSLVTAAAHALAAGDPLGALKRVALRDDAPALALRGIAMAQLGELTRAKTLIRSAARAFGPKEAVARARCVVAEAEIALASRDLHWPSKRLDAARATLEAHGDRANAAHARYLEVRRLLLIGRLDQAETMLATLDPTSFPPALRAAHELMVAGLAMRRLQAKSARAALQRATLAAGHAGIPALVAEIDHARLLLNAPAARLIAHGEARALRLDEVETLLASSALVVDACRHGVWHAGTMLTLARRPVLFTLARALTEAWPGDAPRDALVALAFRAKHADESHRARLRVEIGRLRTVLAPLATIRATDRGFALVPHEHKCHDAHTPHEGPSAPRETHAMRNPPQEMVEVVVLTRPVEEKHAAVLALLADGESWSSSALALALGASQRTAQRILDALASADKVQSFGQGRARRWMTPPMPGFATALLLPPPLPGD